MIEVNRRDNVKLWRNVGWGEASAPEHMGEWLAVQLEQTGPTRDGIESWIEVQIGDRTVWRGWTVGGGHASGQLGWIHIGMGAEDRVRLRVQWPDGEVGSWMVTEAGNFAIVERGAAKVRTVLVPEG